jgi:hypothetical protein
LNLAYWSYLKWDASFTPIKWKQCLLSRFRCGFSEAMLSSAWYLVDWTWSRRTHGCCCCMRVSRDWGQWDAWVQMTAALTAYSWCLGCTTHFLLLLKGQGTDTNAAFGRTILGLPNKILSQQILNWTFGFFDNAMDNLSSYIICKTIP